MKVLMLPTMRHFRREESGIKRVCEGWLKYGPQFGITFVDEGEEYDLKSSHAGTNTENIQCAHLHGLYFSGDFPVSRGEWRVNANAIEAARQADAITVPSEWVAEIIRRDMRREPVIIWHGIEWDEWQGYAERGNYAIWAKNRPRDVCSPEILTELAASYGGVRFVTTFAPKRKLPNISVMGVIPHEQMKQLIMGAGIYLSTTKETFGIATLEAMAAGIPILGFANGGNLELVEHGVNGYLAKPGDISDLIDGFAYCQRYAKTLGDNGREMARKWTWQVAVEKVAGVYRKILSPEPPNVAVIIPSYQYSDKVGRAIQSALRQTYPHLTAVVVVDDGTPDNGATERVVREWMERDSRVRYIRQNNSGVAVARNTGIASIDTKYICCLDADDQIEPEFLTKCVRALERDHSLGIAYTALRWVKADGTTGVSPWPGEWNFDKQLQRQNQVPTCCVFRREMWACLGGYKKRYCPIGAGSEDAEFWTRAGAYGWKGERVTAEPLFVYSIGGGHVTGNKDYHEVDWLAWHPWVEDGKHPFASYATPTISHPVRQYDEPQVSVIIPVGPGHEGSVEDAIDSVEAQTDRKWELIVVWDREDEIPQKYRKCYPFIHWVHTDGVGAGAARNEGAKIARASFLLFLDADDWLYPHAIERMFEEWSHGEAVIYSDYIGKAYVDKIEELDPDLQQRIVWRQEDGLTAIRYDTIDYDVDRAQKQPDTAANKVYVWCNISSLVPRAWFQAVGGFDESLPSWEDIDLWWRLAKAGKDFRRIPEPLLVYHFYGGRRRDLGVAEHQALMAYLKEKHEELEIMACPSCGHRKRSLAEIGPVMKATTAPNMTLSDSDFKMCLYRHPNRGQHMVIGQAVFANRLPNIHMIADRGPGFRIHYGFRGGGDRFLVHIEDIKLAPHLFAPVGAVIAPVEEKEPTPAPREIAEEPRSIVEVVELGGQEIVLEIDTNDEVRLPEPQSINVDEIMHPPTIRLDSGMKEREELEALREKVRQYETKFSALEETTRVPEKLPQAITPAKPNGDLQKIAGVTVNIANQMVAAGITDRDGIIRLGLDGLQKFTGIGEARAKRILEAASAPAIAP